jgi:hypothetical protein
MRLKFRQEDN